MSPGAETLGDRSSFFLGRRHGVVHAMVLAIDRQLSPAASV
jgi:hypothetical protein